MSEAIIVPDANMRTGDQQPISALEEVPSEPHNEIMRKFASEIME